MTGCSLVITAEPVVPIVFVALSGLALMLDGVSHEANAMMTRSAKKKFFMLSRYYKALYMKILGHALEFVVCSL